MCTETLANPVFSGYDKKRLAMIMKRREDKAMTIDYSG